MRILLVNKFFYPRGGDCIVAMNTRRLLKSKGHEVAVFSMDYPDNILLPDCVDYASPISFDSGIGGKLKAFRRVVGRGDIRRSVKNVLDKFRPDVVHLHNVHSYLSPLIGEMAHKRGIRTVWTLHDYKLFCAAYLCRAADGSNCHLCADSSSSKVLANRCMKGRFVPSLIAKIESDVWSRRRLDAMTDRFIAPSRFMAEMMNRAGFTPEKINVISNFIDSEKVSVLENMASKHVERKGFCYIGRLSKEKGVATMIKAAIKSGVTLNIAGDGPEGESLRREFSSVDGINFLGYLDAKCIAELLAGSRASVLPSECYENNPLGVIESFAAGTPAIGAAIGGIPELITPQNGLTFTSGSVDELAVVMRKIEDECVFDNVAISKDALKRYGADAHYEKLMAAYTS